MKYAVVAALALAACGGPATKGPQAPTVEVAPPPPPPFVVAKTTSIGTMIADATHLYWSDDESIYRRALGPDAKLERLFVSPVVIDLVVGASDVFFVDDQYQLRAMPRAGGTPRVLHQLEAEPWGMYAEGDTVWVATYDQLLGFSPSGPRTIQLPIESGPFAGSDGKAYTTGYTEADEPALLEIDLASGTIKELAHDYVFGDTQAITVVGNEAMALMSDGVVAVDLAKGTVNRSFYGYGINLAGDARGYAVSGYGFIVAHSKNQAPRLVRQSTDEAAIGAAMVTAGDYVYFTMIDNETSETEIAAVAREDGAILMRVPLDGELNAMTVTPDGAVYAGMSRDEGSGLYQVGTRKTRSLAMTGYLESLVSDDEYLVSYAEGQLYGATRKEPDLGVIAEPATVPLPVIHKGKVYWGDGAFIRAASLPTGRTIDVLDASTSDDTWYDLSIGEVAFAADHLFFAVNVGDRQGIAKIDEDRKVDWHWTWEMDEEWSAGLDASVVAIGDQLFIHDGTYVYAVAMDGTAKTIYSGKPDFVEDATKPVNRLWAAGDHLIAWISPGSDTLVELSPDGGAPRTIWRTSPDFSSFGSANYVGVSNDAVFVYIPDLAAIAKIPL